MKKLHSRPVRLLSAFALVSTAFAASAEDIRVNRWERRSLFAAEAATNVVDGKIVVASEGRLVKTGAGVVTVPVGNLASARRTEIDVVGGSLALTGSDIQRQASVPSGIRVRLDCHSRLPQ